MSRHTHQTCPVPRSTNKCRQVTKTRLSGSIPTSIGLLTGLTVLDFHDNALVGTIPSELALLSGVSRFLLNSNSISGSVPVALGQLKTINPNFLLDVSSTAVCGLNPWFPNVLPKAVDEQADQTCSGPGTVFRSCPDAVCVPTVVNILPDDQNYETSWVIAHREPWLNGLIVMYGSFQGATACLIVSDAPIYAILSRVRSHAIDVHHSGSSYANCSPALSAPASLPSDAPNSRASTPSR